MTRAGGPMSDLAKFLAARIDEEEHWAHMAEAGRPPGRVGRSEHYPFMATDITPSKATFIRRHDPVRVLREVDAKRKILAEHVAAQAWSYPPGDGDEALQEALDSVVRHLAAIWGDHEDYDPAWKE